MNWLPGLRRTEPEAEPVAHELSSAELNELMGRLPEHRVESAEEMGPDIPGWLAIVEIAQPAEGLRILEHQLTLAVESRLTGRKPFFFVEGDSFKGWFDVTGVTDADFGLVQTFAKAIASAIGSGRDAVRVATIDWFAPEQLRSTSSGFDSGGDGR